MLFPAFKPMQGCVRDAGFFAELGIRKFTARFPQVFSELNI